MLDSPPNNCRKPTLTIILLTYYAMYTTDVVVEILLWHVNQSEPKSDHRVSVESARPLSVPQMC